MTRPKFASLPRLLTDEDQERIASQPPPKLKGRGEEAKEAVRAFQEGLANIEEVAGHLDAGRLRVRSLVPEFLQDEVFDDEVTQVTNPKKD